MTPLHWAAQKGHFDICHLILKNIQDKNPENIIGHTPLTLAARFGHFEVFKLIFDNVDIENIRTDNISPMHEAIARQPITYGHSEIFKLIFDNVQDKNPILGGLTPLRLAEMLGHTHIVEYINVAFNTY